MENKKMSLAALRREANSGTLSLELIERFGKTGADIPHCLQGSRQVVRTNSVSFTLKNTEGKESELYLLPAKLVDYDGSMLTIYEAAHRDPTEEERNILAAARRERESFEKNNMYANSFWVEEDFIAKSSCPWMSGKDKKIKGKKYIPWEDKVRDQSVRGSAILKYKVVSKS